MKDQKYHEILIYYGIKGSGINRVDGWFFSCTKAGRACGLICMADVGESRYFKVAKISMNKNNLIIKTSNVEIVFKITRWIFILTTFMFFKEKNGVWLLVYNTINSEVIKHWELLIPKNKKWVQLGK